jgi:hypothetical protein
MASVIYNQFKQGVMLGSYQLQNLPIWVALVTNSYTPDIDTHSFYSSISGQIIAGSYVAGGAALSSPLVTKDTANDQGVLDASDMRWGGITATGTAQIRACVLYGSYAAGNAASPLIAYIDFGQDYAPVAGNFDITWAAGGILALT